jgi:hypothetical protein
MSTNVTARPPPPFGGVILCRKGSHIASIPTGNDILRLRVGDLSYAYLLVLLACQPVRVESAYVCDARTVKYMPMHAEGLQQVASGTVDQFEN